MTIAGIVIRWAHLLPTLLLVGTFATLLLAGRSDRPTARQWEARLTAWTRRLVLLTLVTGVAVLAHQAAHAAGRPAAAFDPRSWVKVAIETQFGTVWMVRHGLLLLLAGLVFFREREDSVADWAAFRGEAWLIGTAGAAALAWAGHAAAVEPGGLAAALADAAHLVAAGVWLGALPGLALLLRAAAREDGADSRPYAVLAVRRFSTLALASMVILVATGVWNTWSQVGDVPSLLGTRYGALLLLKIFLLLPILGLATYNRSRLLPSLGGDAATVGRPAMARLARAVAAEWALGIAILVVVSVLSTTPPGRHDMPSWLFSFRLDYAATAAQPGVKARFFIGGQIAILGVLVGIVGALTRRWRPALLAGGAAALAIGLWVALPPLAVDAYPTTYRRPSVPYTALSVTTGLALYRERCVVCHGVAGRGDGPGGAGLPKRPADLTAPHTNQHTAGDLFWWLTHGIPAAGMPPFPDLSEDDRWDLINFLRALASAEQARTLTPLVEPNRPWLAAPDFAFTVGPGPGQALRDFRGRRAVLLVLFTLPASRDRLSQLSRTYDTIRGLGGEVIAVALDGGAEVITRLAGDPPILFPVVTEGTAEIARTYSLFRRTLEPDGLRPDPPMPPHMELLIDRGGYVRARFIPGPDGSWPSPGGSRPGPGGASRGWSDPAALVPELQQLARETPAPPPDEHVH